MGNIYDYYANSFGEWDEWDEELEVEMAEATTRRNINFSKSTKDSHTTWKVPHFGEPVTIKAECPVCGYVNKKADKCTHCGKILTKKVSSHCECGSHETYGIDCKPWVHSDWCKLYKKRS